MRWDVAAGLDDDLRAVAQRDRRDVAVPALAADIRSHRTAKREQAVLREGHPPDGEEVAERQVRAIELEHAGRRERADRVAAPASEADARWDDDDAPAREQL